MKVSLDNFSVFAHTKRVKIVESDLDLARSIFLQRFVKGARAVLDCGCVGEDWRFEKKVVVSTLQSDLEKTFNELVGIDLNISGLTSLRNEVHSLLLAGDVNFLPFREKTFDVIIAGELLEHLSDLKGYLKEVHRTLNDDGIFVGTVPNAHNVIGLLKLIVQGDTPPQSKLSTHVHLFDDWTLPLLLLQNALLVESIGYISCIRQPYTPLFKVLWSVLPRLSSTIGFVARKIEVEYARRLEKKFMSELYELKRA